MLLRPLLLLLLALLLIRAVWRLLIGIVAGASGTPVSSGRRRTPVRGERMVRDPVCGTFVVPSQAPSVFGANGVRHYFCSERCRDAFDAKAHGRTA